MTAALNIPLLDRLRAAGGDFVPWPALGADPARVGADVDALAEFGFKVERHPMHGVAYRGPSLRLCPDQIEHELGTAVVGRQVAVWNRVGSTNDLAMRAAASRSNHGLAILAEEQTAGRGSRGRVWTAPAGSSILLSVLLFPPPGLDDPIWLNACAALGVAELVDEWLAGRDATAARPAVTIKWPNDVRVGGRKVAGILVERGKGTVIGIGLNVNLGLADLPADLRAATTSLAVELGRPVDRSAVARDLLRQLDCRFDRTLVDGPDHLGGAYNRYSEHVGREVEVATPDGPVVGRLASIDLRAGLRVGRDAAEARAIPLDGFTAIANRPGSTRWTSAEESVWWGLPADTIHR